MARKTKKHSTKKRTVKRRRSRALGSPSEVHERQTMSAATEGARYLSDSITAAKEGRCSRALNLLTSGTTSVGVAFAHLNSATAGAGHNLLAEGGLVGQMTRNRQKAEEVFARSCMNPDLPIPWTRR